MFSRLRSLLVAVANLRGGERRGTVLVISITLLWVASLAVLPLAIPGQQLVAAAVGPTLTLGGYLAGILWPLWRVNWIVRTGVAYTAGAAIWIASTSTPLAAFVLVWHPVMVAIIMLQYHERWSMFGAARGGGLQPGDRFPTFELTDSDGRIITLDGSLAEGPVLFLFYRGDW